jgi:glycosyltransferase involved in cell wall biosynthesis
MTKISEITLAIPFYNTSSYFQKAVELALNDDFVKEIVVNDDHSSEEEWEKLNKIVRDLNVSKIKLFRNEINVGAFRNKYAAVKNSKCEWVYLLDSDNYPAETTLNAIRSIKNPDPNICYAPKKLLVFSNNGFSLEVLYDFNYKKIGINEAQIGSREGIAWFDWFLNTGNFVFNREEYLKRLQPEIEDERQPAYADCLAFSYHWIRKGGFFEIISGLEHHHRLRDESYWHACGENSFLSVEFYKSKILAL